MEGRRAAGIWLWRGVLRGLVVVSGFALVAVGVALLVLPGPGLAFIAGGFALLGRQFAWARRANAAVLRQMSKAKARAQRRRRRGAGDRAEGS